MLGLKHPTGRDGGISRPACAAGRSRLALPPPVWPKAKAAGNGRFRIHAASSLLVSPAFAVVFA